MAAPKVQTAYCSILKCVGTLWTNAHAKEKTADMYMLKAHHEPATLVISHIPTMSTYGTRGTMIQDQELILTNLLNPQTNRNHKTRNHKTPKAKTLF